MPVNPSVNASFRTVSISCFNSCIVEDDFCNLLSSVLFSDIICCVSATIPATSFFNSSGSDVFAIWLDTDSNDPPKSSLLDFNDVNALSTSLNVLPTISSALAKVSLDRSLFNKRRCNSRHRSIVNSNSWFTIISIERTTSALLPL